MEPELEQAVRALATSLLAAAVGDESAGEVRVQSGNQGVTVLIAADFASHAAAIQRGAQERFPEVEIEVRAGTFVVRGGAGFGRGRHLIAVLGGKGGVGKSTVAVNLALTLTAMGVKTGLLDADFNAPDLPHLLGIAVTRPLRPSRHRLAEAPAAGSRGRPFVRYGVELASVGFEVPERMAPLLSSRFQVASLLRDYLFDLDWSADVVLIDAPPGTGEEVQVMARALPLSGALIVTTPQDLAQMDAERTVTLLEQHGVPVIGMVQNMAALRCPHCEHDIDLYRLSERLVEAGVPVLGRVPFDVRLAHTADEGRPLVLGDPRGDVALQFAIIGSRLRRWLAARPA